MHEEKSTTVLTLFNETPGPIWEPEVWSGVSKSSQQEKKDGMVLLNRWSLTVLDG